MTPLTNHAAHPLVRLWQYGDRYRRRIVMAVVWTTLNKIADVFPELLIGAAVDVVVRGSDSFLATTFGIESTFTQLLVLAAINLVVWVIESITDYLAATRWRRLAQSMQHDLRTDTYRHLQELEVSWFEDTTSGGLLAVLNDDVNQLERFLDTGAETIIQLFWNVVIVGAVFFLVSWQLAVVAFLPIPVIVVGSLRYQRRLEPLYASVRERVSEISATLSANLGGITTIKAFGAERREGDRVEAVSQDYVEANSAAIQFSSAFVPIIRMAILVRLHGHPAHRWLDDDRGDSGRRPVLGARLHDPAAALAADQPGPDPGPLPTSHGLDAPHPRPARRRAGHAARHRLAPVAGRGATWSCSGVTFGYADGPDVLRGITLRVPAGETHAIVGSTGAGKSTLVRLLLRFHDPRSGTVALDGHDLRTLTYASLRGAIGYVAQDVFLFHGSVRDNIAYGRPDATDAEIEEAARLAEAHDFVLELRAGLRHRRRRARRQALGRPAPAALDRARDPARPCRPPARRGHLRRGQRDRGGDPALARPRRRRTYGRRHRPPALDGPRRRPHLGPRGRVTSPRRARTTSWWPPADSTQHCGACRPAMPSTAPLTDSLSAPTSALSFSLCTDWVSALSGCRWRSVVLPHQFECWTGWGGGGRWVARWLMRSRRSPAGTGLGLSGQQAVQRLSELNAAIALLTADRLSMLSVVQESGVWGLDASRSAAAWLAREERSTRAAAGSDLKLARLLDAHLPLTSAALREGAVPVGHARVLARTCLRTEAMRVMLTDPDRGEGFLLTQAGLGAEDFQTFASTWAYRVDPDAADAAYRESTDDYFLQAAVTTGGVAVRAFLDPVAGECLISVLRAEIGVPAVTDTRGTPRRMHDALASVMNRALAGGRLGDHASVRPSLVVHVPYATLEAARTGQRQP